jgi:tRNA threonylcarbamoyladenosine biosynthesis protein TsaB
MAAVILGFDTATPDTAVAASGAGEPIEVLLPPREDGRPAHGTVLLGAIEDVVERAGGWESVERIAVGVGPGSFTGLRIGISTARALAQARELPLVAVASTAALLAGLAESQVAGGRPRLAVIDARRGEVFVALDAGEGPGEPRVCPPGELAGTFAPGELAGALAAGDGSVRFRAEIEAAGIEVLDASDPAHRLSARHICSIGVGIEPGPPELVTPNYLRRPDARRWDG